LWKFVKWVVKALTNSTFSPVSGWMRDRMFGVGELGMEREALLDRHRRAEAGLDAVARAQRRDRVLICSGSRS
jgi:hypothetical protein